MDEYILLVIPLLLIHGALAVMALLDLRQREQVLGNHRWLWIIIIIFIQFIGPVVYFTIGRRE